MQDKHAIPAASIDHARLTAIAVRFPEEAREITRLNELMQQGQNSVDDFVHLCTLMHKVGLRADAEYLLRRNQNFPGGRELYDKLFGSILPKDFALAIERFAAEFGLELTLREDTGFLDQEYASKPMPGQYPRFRVLSGPCIVRFDYHSKDFVMAEIVAANAADVNCFDLAVCIFMRWQHQRWRLMDPRDCP